MKLETELIGSKFDRLNVLNVIRRNGRQVLLCSCDCGMLTSAEARNVKSGHTRSCGCLSREATSAAKKTHGCSRGAGGNPITKRAYGCWAAMKSRCGNPNHEFYADYGGRGISVCERWIDSFLCFIEDMGLPPTKLHTIERRDVNGNYDISNCVWATMKEQSLNKRPYRSRNNLPRG